MSPSSDIWLECEHGRLRPMGFEKSTWWWCTARMCILVFVLKIRNKRFQHSVRSLGSPWIIIHACAHYHYAVCLGSPPTHTSCYAESLKRSPSRPCLCFSLCQTKTVPIQCDFPSAERPQPHTLHSAWISLLAFILSTSGTRRLSLRPLRIICMYSFLSKSSGSMLLEQR